MDSAKIFKNVVDGDKLLVDAVNKVLSANPTHDKISTVAVLNDVWKSWGKGSKDPTVIAKYENLRNKVYEIQAQLSQEEAKKGNTVLIASSRPAIHNIVDTVVYQGDTETLKASRADSNRENVLHMSDKEIVDKNDKFLQSIKILKKGIVTLKPNTFIADILGNKKEKLVGKAQEGRLKITNGNITDTIGNTDIQINSMEELISVSKELENKLKELGTMTYSKDSGNTYTNTFKFYQDMGIEFKPFKLVLVKQLDRRGAMGAHDSRNGGRIGIATHVKWDDRSPQKTLLHEYTHRITSGNLDKYPTLYSKVTKLMEHVNKHGVKIKDWYGMTDPHEFLAEVMSNPAFQEVLSKIPPYNKKSIVDSVKEIIATLVNRMSTKEKNALTEGIELTIEVAKMRDTKADTKAYDAKIDVTDPVASMKVLEDKKLQKEKDREVLRMVEDPNRQAEQVMDKIHDEQYRSVRDTLDGIVTKIVKPTMVTSGIHTLLKYTLNKKLITAGVYDPKTNVIKMSTLTGEAATSKARELVLNKYMEKVYGVTKDMSDEEYATKAEAMAEDPKYKEVIKAEMQNEAADIIMAYVQAKGSHAVSHELIHAGAVNYMRSNPNSELTKNIHKLFDIAKTYYKETGSKISEHAPYWMTDVDEFLAETLTNPVTIQYMNRIQVGESVRPKSVFQELISTVLQMLGMKPEDTVYQAALHSYMGILQEVAMNKQREKEVTDPEKYAQDRDSELKLMMDKGELDEFPNMKQYVEEVLGKQLAIKQLLQGMKDC